MYQATLNTHGLCFPGDSAGGFVVPSGTSVSQNLGRGVTKQDDKAAIPH